MATYYLIRHGEADYSELMEHHFFGFGRDLAPLSEKGIAQAEETANDGRLKTAELIIASPYTRALQTAQIISRNTGIAVKVELDLHEWIPDLSNKYTTSEEAFRLTDEFIECKGAYPAGTRKLWETVEDMRIRMRRVADKYAEYHKVIFVGHGMSLRTLAYIEEMKPAEIVECKYEIGQEECMYSFC
ncbi:histidine phosphatase family protein [Anaeromicropila herbilytica]|uniref:Phosphoglycerate mutase n=1 Tax=Anaeromicropila herbilytica TaxID=2785025 RepID=A0A7R7IDJ0_9FIRM|nr:histidine phosphatase family protein [Anaeromicropila herbilytica]BCN31011.1 phosphoglycerate mutase [Anaeromicropila herbilytica]